MTPRQFSVLVERHKDQNNFLELLMGIQTASTVNSSFNAPKEPKKPHDFMPSEWSKRVEKKQVTTKPTKKTRQAFADSVRNLFMASPRIVKADTVVREEIDNG